MTVAPVALAAVPDFPLVTPQDDLADILISALTAAGMTPASRDVLVVAQKIVSKAEGQVLKLEDIEPSAKAQRWARDHGKDARLVEVVLRESKRVLRMERGLLIVETQHGFVCANAGVDTSNIASGQVTLLPKDSDRSAARIRQDLEREFGVRLALIVSDTFGRPWRVGLVNVALGVSGMTPFIDYRGQKDCFGEELHATQMAVADQLASTAELVMGKTKGVPVALIRGFDYPEGEGEGRQILRSKEKDLFR